MKKFITILIFIFAFVAFAKAQSWNCDSTLYLSQNNTLYMIDMTTNPFTYTTLFTLSIQFNAIGINPSTGIMYGMITPNSNHLIRINKSGTYTDLGAVTNLPSNLTYNTGECDINGNFYVKRNALNDTLYKINLSTKTATVIKLDAFINVSDLGYGTTGNKLYGVNAADGKLVSIDLDAATLGHITVIGGGSGAVQFGAMYGTNSGQMYGSNNVGGFYQFNVSTGARTLISTSPPSNANDGAVCPIAATVKFKADLKITKTDTATAYIPGCTMFYTIVAGNDNGPFGAQGAIVSDTLPAGISTSDVSYSAVAAGSATTTVSGTQTGAIQDTVSLPVGGKVTYTVNVKVPLTYTGNLVNKVAITPPSNITDTDLTNNTATDTDTQATAYTVTASPNPVCAGSSLQLNVNATGAASYVWTGPNSFTSSLQNPVIGNIKKANTGTYTVTVNNPGITCALSVNVIVNICAIISNDFLQPKWQ